MNAAKAHFLSCVFSSYRTFSGTERDWLDFEQAVVLYNRIQKSAITRTVHVNCDG